MNALATFPSYRVQMDDDRRDRDASWLAHLRRRRAIQIRAYLAAEYGLDRRTARTNALHYSRLVRRWVHITGVVA